MALASDIISAAFIKVGVDTPTTAQNTSALVSLNNMLSSFNVELLQPSVTRENFTLTIGDADYTMGSSGDFNTVRPIAVANAYLRDSNNYDWPLEIIAAKDANRVVSKAQQSRPGRVYFIPEITKAKFIFENAPDAAYGFYVETWKPFTEFATAADTVTLPPEFKEALVYNLAVSLGEDWDRPIPRTVVQRAKETKENIDLSNAATRAVSEARLGFITGGSYDITTDTYHA